MDNRTQTADANGRVILPKGFADAIVVIEQLNDAELRIRKANVAPGEATSFREERAVVLSDAERDRFLSLLDAPPKPNAALKQAVQRHGRDHA